MLFTLWLNNVPGPGESRLPPDTAALFGRLYEQYLPKIFQYVCYRIGDKDTAQDITSLIFEKAINKYESYDSRKASFATWIFTIAHHALIDYYRDRGREQEQRRRDMVEITVNYTSPEEEAAHTEDVKKLRAALAGLKENEREIITMKFSGDMTNREIARILGLSESNVGVILCRVVRRLRTDFSGW